MTRLPTPGGDSGNWGSILNDYLSQVHAPDGTLKTDSVTSDAIAPNAIDSVSIADGSITETLLDTAVQTKLNQAAPVTSVATKTGDVTLTKSDVGLAQVDNTSDATKNSATATLTNKTLTSPKIDYIKDSINNNYVVGFSAGPSAVNYLMLNGKATSFPPEISAHGADTDVSINLIPKNSGTVQVNSVPVVTISDTQTLTNKTLTSPTINNAAALSVGAATNLATASPICVSLGGTYGNNTRGTSGNLKLRLYDNGTGIDLFGIGVSDGVTEYQVPNSSNSHRFYVGGVERLQISNTDVLIGGVSAVTTTGTQSLSNKTLTAPTLSGNVALSYPTSLQVNGNIDNTQYAATSRTFAWPAHTPFSQRNWHDILQLGNWIPFPTQEVYDGSWSTQTVNKNLFSGNEYGAYSLTDGTTTTAVRWTWNHGNLSYSTVRWWMIGYGYQVPAGSNNVFIESSPDGVSWTTRHDSTSTAGSACPVYYYANFGGHSYVRLTITTTNAQPILVHYIKALTARTGSQGGGSETQYPYTWDADKNITARASLSITTPGTASNSAVTVGGSQTLTNKTLTNPTLSGAFVGGLNISGTNSYYNVNGQGALSAPSASGAFCTLAAAGDLVLRSDNGGDLLLYGRGAGGGIRLITDNGGTVTERMAIAASGEVSVSGNVAMGSSAGASVPTTTPLNIEMGSTYGTNAVGHKDNLKVILYNDINSSKFGFGISADRLEYQVPNASQTHSFYTGGTERFSITSTATNVTNSLTVSGIPVVTTTGTQTLTNKTLTTPTISTSASITSNTASGLQLSIDNTTTAGRSEIILNEATVAKAYLQWRGTTNPSIPNTLRLGTNAGTSADIILGTGGGTHLLIAGGQNGLSTGYVGIGTATPASLLDVGGEIRASTAGSNTNSVVTVGGAQTLTNKTLADPAVTGATRVAQGGTLELYNTADQTTDYERMRAYYSGSTAAFTIAGESGGTGTPRPLYLGNNSQLRANISSTSGLVSVYYPSTPTVGAIWFKVDGTQAAASGTQYGVQIANTINQTSTAGYTALLINPTETSTGSGTKLLADFQVGGVSKVSITNLGQLKLTAATTSTPSMNIPTGSAPTSPSTGDVYSDGTHVYCYLAGTWKQLD